MYLDPLFKIPVVQKVLIKEVATKKGETSTAAIDDKQPTLKNVVESQRRCDPLSGDCTDDVQKEFEKILAIEPFVQTRLPI
jgi:hypothetical protein